MDFYSRAWTAAAENYGAARAEKWGRWARLWQTIKIVAIIALALGLFYLVQRGPA